MLLIYYPKCTTCQKALRWLKEQAIDVTVRDIKLDRPAQQELREWQQRSGLRPAPFF